MRKPVRKFIAMLLMAAALATMTVQPVIAADSTPARSSTSTTAAASKSTGFTTSAKYKYSTIKARIPKYQEYNKDVNSWLTIPGTNINNPIVYYPTDNNQYLYRTWDGVFYPNTSYLNYIDTAIYADYRVKWGDSWQNSSQNIVLYGHNWTNLRAPLDIGSDNNHIMFGQLPSYTNLSFAKENPYIYYSTDAYEGIWKVFAVAYVEQKNSFVYNSPNMTTENYVKLLKEWKQRSMFNFDVDVQSTDTILTLLTCTRYYSDMGANQKYVVVARLLRDGESEDDPVKVEVNNNQKPPQF